MAAENILTIAYLNIRGQSGLPVDKQLQIEAFAKYNNCDIINLQEAHIESETFSTCNFIQSTFNIIDNNSRNKFGTASLVKSGLNFENVRNDLEGRALFFDIGDMTFGNLYLPSGTDARSRSKRESYCCEVLPNLMVNSKETGCIGGDFNCIVSHMDATNYPEAKMSRGLQRLIQLKNLQDSYRTLHPTSRTFSRYYENTRAEGATRIDRNYHFGEITVKDVWYQPLAFSDHFGLVIKIILPNQLTKILSPKCRFQFKLTAEVIKDKVFKERLGLAMVSWDRVREFDNRNSLSVLQWWEMLVKPGVRQLDIQRSKEIRKKSRGS